MLRRRGLLAALVVSSGAGCLQLTEQDEAESDSGSTSPGIDPGEIGESRWSFTADAPFQSAGIAVDDDRVIAASDDETVYALDLNTGDVEWQFSDDDWPPHVPFTIAGSTVFLTTNSGTVAVDAETGEENWRTDEALAVQRSSPLAVDDRVYVHGGSLTPADNGIVELDRDSGELNWRFETDGRTPAAPVMAGDTLLIGVNPHDGSRNGRLFGVDTATGEERWRIDHENILGGIELAGGIAYATAENGPLLAFDPGEGDVLWETDEGNLMNNNLSGGNVVTTQAHVFDDRLLFNGRHILEYDPDTGELIGELEAVEQPAPLFDRRGRLYAVSAVPGDGGLYSVDLDDSFARLLFSIDTDNGRNQVVTGTFDANDHTLCIADVSTLNAVWYAD